MSQSLYRYFKPVAKSLPDPEGTLSQTLPSATIKAANEAMHAGVFQTTEGAIKKEETLRETYWSTASTNSKIRLMSWKSSSNSSIQRRIFH